MPYNFTPIAPSGRSREKTPIDQIDNDVKQAVDEALEWCAANEGRLEGEMGNQDAANQFLQDARDYAYQRKPRVVVTGNSTKKGHVRWRVDLYVKTDDVKNDKAE